MKYKSFVRMQERRPTRTPFNKQQQTKKPHMAMGQLSEGYLLSFFQDSFFILQSVQTHDSLSFNRM